MTLIASLEIDGVPCLIGDIVVSASMQSNHEISLPSRGMSAKTNGNDTDWYISDVVQKIAMISDDLVIAWSGSEALARTVVEELKHLEVLSEDLAFDFELYAHNFSEYENSKELSFVGWIQDGANLTRFGHCVKRLRSEFLGNPWVAGSGEDAFAIAASTTNVSGVKFASGTVPFGNAANVCHTICDRLISDEFENGSSLKEYFGGAYEICIWRNGHFQKLQPRITVLSDIQFYRTQFATRNRALIRIDYINELMRIYVAVQPGATSKSWVQFVRPVDSRREDYTNGRLTSLSNPSADLDSEWITNVICTWFTEFPIVSLDAVQTSWAYPGLTVPEVVGCLSKFEVKYPDYVIREILGRLTNQVARFHLRLPATNSTAFPLPPELRNAAFVEDEN